MARYRVGMAFLRQRQSRFPYAQVFGVFFNPENEPLYSDAAVRKALSQAIDRDALVKNVLGGYAVPAYGPLPGSSTPTATGSSTQNNGTGGPIALAQQTLTAGGWKFSTSTNQWTKGGQQLNVTLTTSNVPELKALATQIQADWQAINVPVTLDFVSPSDLTQTIIRPRAFSALLFGEVHRLPTPISTRSGTAANEPTRASTSLIFPIRRWMHCLKKRVHKLTLLTVQQRLKQLAT